MPANSELSEEKKAELLKVMKKIARALFESLGVVQFMAVLIGADGEHHPIGFEPGIPKKVMGDTIRKLVKEIKPDVVVLIGEAWAIDKPEESMTTEQLKQLASKYGSLEKHPWRKDCLALDFEYRDGTKQGWHWYIVVEDGKRVLRNGNFKWANGTRVVEASGHLENFF